MVDFAEAVDRPPAIEIDVERSPHGHPADDDQAFLNNGAELPQIGVDGLGGRDTGSEKPECDQETHPAVTEKLPQLPLIKFITVVEVVADRFLKNSFRLSAIGGLAEVNDQFERFLEIVFLGPADDELLGLRIEIAFMKGGGIDGVEDLLEVLNFYLDELMA